MHPTRRWLLASMSSLVVISCKRPGTVGTEPIATDDTGSLLDTGLPTTPTEEDPLTPGTWSPPAADELLFPAGVQTGDPRSDSAVISVLTEATDLLLTVVEQHEQGWRLVTEVPIEAGEHGYQLLLTDLQPATTYRWAVVAGGSWSRVGRFRTAPADDALEVFTFGATSCLGGNEPWPELSRAAEEGLDLFCFLGDTVYADWGAAEPVRAKWQAAMRQQGMIDLTTSTPVVATWDDHEVWNNWSPVLTPTSQVDEARLQFRSHLPQTVGPHGGIWRSLRWGATAELFVLDCRGERALGRYVSEAQLDWLIEGLHNSPCRFKILVDSVPATDFSFLPIAGQILAEDRWQGYPAQRNRLMEAAGQVEGVLFVAGDFHVGGAATVDGPQGNAPGVFEVLAGPGGSAISSVYSFLPEGPRLRRLITQFNYASFTCDPIAGTIDVRWVDASGATLRSLVIEA